RTPGRHRLERIDDEVEHGLAHQTGIDPKRRYVRGELDLHVNAGSLGQLWQDVRHRTDDALEGRLLHTHRVRTRALEEVGDDRVEALGCFADDRKQALDVHAHRGSGPFAHQPP